MVSYVFVILLYALATNFAILLLEAMWNASFLMLL